MELPSSPFPGGEIPQGSVSPAMQQLVDQLQQAAEAIPATQKKLLSLTGVAWSADRMVKVVVGARGQLVDLEIDPRVFRKPDAAALTATILATSAKAIQNVQDEAREIMDDLMPPDFDDLRVDQDVEAIDDPLADLMRSDAEIYAERRSER